MRNHQAAFAPIAPFFRCLLQVFSLFSIFLFFSFSLFFFSPKEGL